MIELYLFRSEFRGVFQDTATTLYKKMMLLLQEKLKPIIVSAMLDHDSLQGTSAGKSIEVFFETRNFFEIFQDYSLLTSKP